MSNSLFLNVTINIYIYIYIYIIDISQNNFAYGKYNNNMEECEYLEVEKRYVIKIYLVITSG